MLQTIIDKSRKVANTTASNNIFYNLESERRFANDRETLRSISTLEARDCFQQASLALWRKMETGDLEFEKVSEGVAWMVHATKMNSFNAVRKLKTYKPRNMSLDPLTAREEKAVQFKLSEICGQRFMTPEQAYLRKEKIMEANERLWYKAEARTNPHLFREIIDLHLDGLTYREIGKKLGCSKRTIINVMNIARNNI
jgi:RNA polymerase sigma factor (sigma-70 family)